MKFTLFIIISFYAGCSSLSDEELWKMVEQAKANKNWDSTLQVSQRILQEYPDGKFGGWAQFAIAESYRFKNQPREALNNYKIFVDRFPTMQPAALSLFLIGYIYGNNLNMNDSAKIYYEQFLTQYPNHDLVPSVKLELESLGKSPQEVLEQTTKQQRSVTRK
ncbi:MAG: tetratricopeptide repeat protein [Bacteroidota bacterium]